MWSRLTRSRSMTLNLASLQTRCPRREPFWAPSSGVQSKVALSTQRNCHGFKALPGGAKDVLHQINKLCRECHAQRFQCHQEPWCPARRRCFLRVLDRQPIPFLGSQLDNLRVVASGLLIAGPWQCVVANCSDVGFASFDLHQKIWAVSSKDRNAFMHALHGNGAGSRATARKKGDRNKAITKQAASICRM